MCLKTLSFSKQLLYIMLLFSARIVNFVPMILDASEKPRSAAGVILSVSGNLRVIKCGSHIDFIAF